MEQTSNKYYGNLHNVLDLELLDRIKELQGIDEEMAKVFVSSLSLFSKSDVKNKIEAIYGTERKI